MSRARLALPLAVTALAALLAPPAQAAWTTIGSDLAEPATIAHGDPNDFVMWPGTTPGASIEVPVDGQAIIMRMKGGTTATAAQHDRGEAFDPNFDIFHFLVLSPRSGNWVTTSSSQDLEARRIGDNATPDTIETYKSGANNPLCVKKGDRIAVASVGGYVPGIFENGLPYQIFGSSAGATSFGYQHGPRVIQMESSGNPDVISPTSTFADEELLLQVVVGTGPNARPACGGTAPGGSEAGDIPEAADAAPAAVGAGVSPGGKVKPAMATPLNKRRKLGRDKRVGVSLTCRADGAPCAGTIELRVHKKRIGLARYAGLAPGATGTFPVKLSRKGVYFVKADSDRKMLTSVVVTADGGRKDGGKMYVLPARRR